MKKIFSVVSLLIILVVIGGAVYVANIDWNTHKAVIAKQFYDATGKEIAFDGKVSFKFLPRPYLQAENVRILGQNKKGLPLVEIADLTAELSLRPLISGQFDVERMEVHNPKINIEVEENGKLNWQAELTREQKQNIQDAKIALNSVSVVNAVLSFEDIEKGVNFKLENLNGEIIASSIWGPYRVEGNYIQNNMPEGFAITLGQFSDSQPTTVNIAITNPITESYIRFDGNFMLKNRILSGSLMLESKKLQQFLQTNLIDYKADSRFDYPLALTSDINVNAKQFNMSNMVVKYGDTQGAGNLQMPFNDLFNGGPIKPRADIAFNFTDLDLNPVAEYIKDFVENNYKEGQIYNPQLGVDVLADIKAVKTTLKDQQIKNFELSVDWVENILTTNNLSGVLPGGTDFKVKGIVTSYEEKPFYNLETNIKTKDLLTTLKWLDIAPQVNAASTYKKAEAAAKISGNMQKIQIAPFKLVIDKSSLNGDIGLKLGERKDLYLDLKTDMINFDNYLEVMPEEVAKKSWLERMNHRFAKLKFLDDFDMQMIFAMDMGIYDRTPFEKVDFKANLLNGELEVEKLDIASVYDSKMKFKGNVSNWKSSPEFKNWNYEIESNNFKKLAEKIGYNGKLIQNKNIKNFALNGILNGGVKEIATKMKLNVDDLTVSYSGKIKNNEPNIDYSGILELEHSEFVSFLHDLGIAYTPSASAMGLFQLKTKIDGNEKQFSAKELDANIGFSNFKGSVNYEEDKDGRPNVITELEINEFNCERFAEKNSKIKNQIMLSKTSNEKFNFLPSVSWSKKAYDYSAYQDFDANGKFKIKKLSTNKYSFNNANISLELQKGELNINDFAAETLGGKVNAKVQLQTQNDATLNGQIKLKNAEISRLGADGVMYAVYDGTFDVDVNFATKAITQQGLVKNLTGNAEFKFNDFNVKGWNLQRVKEDIIRREVPEGLQKSVEKAMTTGKTHINEFKGSAQIVEGKLNWLNSAMENDLADIRVIGWADLNNWSLDSNLVFKFIEPKYFPGYKMQFSGSMANPQIKVDVSDLFGLYKDKQDKKEAEIKLANDTKKAKVVSLNEARQKNVDIMLLKVRDELQKQVNDKIDSAFTDKAKTDYKQVYNNLETIENELKAMASKAEANKEKEDFTAKLDQFNRQEMMKIEKEQELISKISLDDAKAKTQDLYGRVVNIYSEAQTNILKYEQLKDEYTKQLIKTESEFKLEQDENINGWQVFIEDKIKGIEALDKKLLDEIKIVKESNDIEKVEDYLQKLNDRLELLTEDVKNIKESMAEYKVYTDEKIKSYEQLYEQELRNREMARKVKANTGSISIKKSGKVVTVKRDIQDIESSEEKIEEGTLRVIDFSKPKVKNETITPKLNNNVITKNRVKRN